MRFPTRRVVPVRFFPPRSLVVLIASSLALGVAQWSRADTGPFPPPLGAYAWKGPDSGSGDGSATDWNNWIGRYSISDGSPPTINRLPPEPGDAFVLDHSFNKENKPHSVSMGGFGFPTSDMQISYYATFTGGSLALHDVSIRSSSNAVGATFPVTFQGTSFAVNSLNVHSDNDTITFNGVTVATPKLVLSGAYSLDAVNFPPPGGTPMTNFNDATVNASVMHVSDSYPYGRFVANVKGSQVESLGIEITSGGNTLENAAELHLAHSQATVHQFLVVGSLGAGRLTVDDHSSISAPTAYVNVGDTGVGTMTISQSSTATVREFNVGVSATGTATIDDSAIVTSDNGTVGAISGMEGTVKIATKGAWNTKALTVGQSGTGTIYVHDQSTLKVDGAAVLGQDAQGRGLLFLTGANAHLDLGASGSLTIGDKGAGELHLEQGAQFTSAGDVSLGKVAKSSGTVIATGKDSKWTVGGNLTIGEHATGRVEINDKATVAVTGAGVFLGKQSDGNGTLVIDGAGSKLDIGSGQLVIADFGKGTLQLQNGALFTMDSLALGNFAGSEGTVTATGANSHWTVNGPLTIGEHGKGRVEINDKAIVTAGGTDLVVGKQADGDGTLVIDGEKSKLDFSGRLVIADSGKGTLQLKNGASLTTGSLSLGKSAGSNGTLDLQDAGSSQFGMKVQGNLTIGSAGRGTVNVNGGYGLTTDGDVVMGESPSSGTQALPDNATVSGVQSAWSIGGNASVGKAANSHATIKVSGGGQLETKGTFFDLGVEANSSGELDVFGNGKSSGGQDGDVVLDSMLRIGIRGKGEVSLDDQANVRIGSALLGVDVGGNGKLRIFNANMTAAGDIDVGGAGTGDVSVSEGGFLTIAGSHALTIDSAPSVVETASVTVGGGEESTTDSGLSAHEINVGLTGRGTLTINDGFEKSPVSVSTTTMHVAQGMGSIGSVTVEQEAKLSTTNLEAGSGGTAFIDVLSSGELKVSQGITLGGSGSATLTVNAGKVTASQISALHGSSITVSNSGDNDGIMLNAGGTFDLGGSATEPAKLTVENKGLVYSLPNGLFRAGSKGLAEVNVRSGGSIQVSSIEVGSAQARSASSLTVSGSTSQVDSARLTIHPGASFTTLLSAQAFTALSVTVNGTLDVQGGALQIGIASSEQLQSGAVTVAPGGELFGTGKIKGNLIAKNAKGYPIGVTGARIEPGNSPGRLTVEGNVEIEPNAILDMQIGGLTAGEQYDVLNVLGSAHVEGSVVLDFIDGFAPKAGDQFSLITGSDLVMAPQISVLNLADGWRYDVLQTGGAWTIQSLSDGVSSVPEPASAAFFLVGAWAAFGSRRRPATHVVA